MNKSIVRVGLLGLVAAAALGLGGCNGNLKEENAQLRENNDKLVADNEKVKTQLTESEARRNEAESKAAQNQAALAQMQQDLANRPPTPDRTMGDNSPQRKDRRTPREEDVTLVVAGDVLFGPGSATLTAGGRKEIDRVISTIKGKYGGHQIRVEGYTDSDPGKKSSFGSNKALSQARAAAVEKYMASKGISASRITAVGMGAEKPKATQAASRRVEIVVVGN